MSPTQLVPRRGKVAQRYDCGDGLMLTQAEIAERAGINRNSASARIVRGVRGAALLLPHQSGKHGSRSPRPFYTAEKDVNLFQLGIELYRAFGDKRVPPIAWLRETYGMCRATAYRYQNRYRAAVRLP
jgi:hypothetical protein